MGFAGPVPRFGREQCHRYLQNAEEYVGAFDDLYAQAGMDDAEKVIASASSAGSQRNPEKKETEAPRCLAHK